MDHEVGSQRSNAFAITFPTAGWQQKPTNKTTGITVSETVQRSGEVRRRTRHPASVVCGEVVRSQEDRDDENDGQ